jgi:hyperosmotically inducible protein
MKTITQSILLVATGSLLSLSACEDRADRDAVDRAPPAQTTPGDVNRTTPAPAGGVTPAPSAPVRDADNTRTNRGDGSTQNLTPIDQSEASEHIKITAEIRRAVMNDSSLSSNAKNSKIITDRTGMVTLRGVVNSQAEKNAIASHARAVAGEANVVNQLVVDAD